MEHDVLAMDDLTKRLNKLYRKQMECLSEINELAEKVPKRKIIEEYTPIFKKEYPPKLLVPLLDLPENKKITRIDLGRKLMIYCRKKKLVNGLTIKCNKKLETIFDEETIEVVRIQYYLDYLYTQEAKLNDRI